VGAGDLRVVIALCWKWRKCPRCLSRSGVPAALLLGADLRRRNGPLGRRPPPQQAGAYANASEEERAAAGDRSPGVLLASGLHRWRRAGGILIAFAAGVLGDFDKAVTAWSAAHNPFFEGGAADLLSLLPYAALILLCTGWRGKSGTLIASFPPRADSVRRRSRPRNVALDNCRPRV